MKKILILLFAVIAGVGIMFAESGTCGDNLTWNLTDGLLTISGTGAMTDFDINQLDDVPWYLYRSSITNITIGNSVQSIGNYAFYGCSSLTRVSIGDNVIKIGYGAFNGCSRLTSVTIPNGVILIDTRAFSGCSSLTSVTIPNSVKIIESNAFFNVSNIVYNGTATGSPWGAKSANGYVDGHLVYSNNTKTNLLACSAAATGEIVIQNSVTSIGRGAFQSCTGLTSVTIPNSVTSIGNYAFRYCSGLTSITIPNSVTSIEVQTFYDCSSLTNVTIPNSVTSIGSGAFKGCSDLTSVTINSTDIVGKKYASDSNIKTIFGPQVTNYIIGDNVTSIGDYAFSGCTNLTSIEIPNGVTGIGDYAFYDCPSLMSIELPNSVASIGNYAFSGCTSLTSIEFPNSVINIGENAFSACTGLTNVTIPNSVTSIGGGVFKGCSGLTCVIIPNSVTNIGENAFSGCTGLTSVTIPNSVTSIGSSAFEDCSGLTSVTIPNSVTSIGGNAFSGCTSLTSVTIPNSVTSIGEYAFNEVPNIVYFGSATGSPWGAKCVNGYVDGWLVYSDASKTNLIDCSTAATGAVEIPNSVTSIEEYTFYGCSGLTNIELPNSVTSIGSSAFEGCSSLTSITIPNSVTNIGSSAFEGCSSLMSVTLGNSVTSIGDRAFWECTGLTSIEIPNSVTSIGSCAFVFCYGLESVTIGSSVTSIGNNAFHYKGDTENITSVIWNAKNGPSINFGSQVTSFTFGDEVEVIPTNLCWGMDKLTNVTIPNSVILIDSCAFVGCSSLTSVEMLCETPPTLADYWYCGYPVRVFSGCDNLSSIYVPCGTLDAYMHFYYFYEDKIKYHSEYTITVNVNIEGAGTVNVPSNTCEQLFATSNYGYHFEQWSDGNTDNPRTIELTQDISLIAEFAKNEYTISTESSNHEWGTTTGDTKGLYLDVVTISTHANYGYHFVSWNDGNTDNPRIITVTEDKTYTAIFAKNVYSITKLCNTAQGSITGLSQAEYLDYITLEAIPNFGYHFTQWKDGVKDNPRAFVITKDTMFTAEFALDRSGKCGNDWGLDWSYDPEKHMLTISGEGAFNEHMECGVEAKPAMTHLVIENGVTSIGESAFSGCEHLTSLTLSESVKSIQNYAFYNCSNLEIIYNYRPTPANTYSTAFDGVDKFECKLFVLATSINMYKAAAVWRDFYYTYAIGATETTTMVDDVIIEPTDNTAVVTWPVSNNAASYTITITKDGEVVCTLIFNSEGQLVGIAFAPSRDGRSQIAMATLTANGMQFTVTGLNSGTHYALNLTAKDSQDAVIASYSGEFTTTSNGGEVTSLDKTTNGQSQISNVKFIKNGQLFIQQGDKTYNAQGARVE